MTVAELKGDRIVLMRAYRAWCTLLLAVLVLGNGSVADGAYAKSRSGSETNDSNQSVQQLLSDNRTDDAEAAARIFRLGGGAVPTLVGALQKRTNVERASLALLYLGGPEERKLVRQFIRTEKDPEKKWVIASFLAGALVEPASADEWSFLESCVKGYKDEAQGFASFSAVLALGTNASPKALQLLQSVGPSAQGSESKNDTMEEAGRAIRWINDRSSSKAPTSVDNGSDSDQIKRAILNGTFFAATESKNLSFEEMKFTEDGRRALVSVDVRGSNKDPHGYQIVLRKDSGAWKITGVWFSWAA